ncbi:MAG: hypothetical protein JO317_02600 [Verrucomicrobiae bacterium]|nr:hypothetical protein [Verrucomicrobiae bacterium]
MLSWFKSGHCERNPDIVWPSRAAKWSGLREAVEGAATEGVPVLIVAHFPDTFDEVQKNLKTAGAVFPTELRQPVDAQPQAVLTMAASFAAGFSAPMLDRLWIVAAERHPLRAREKPIVDFAASLPFPTQLALYASLDEPLFVHCGVSKTLPLLRKVGMDEHSAIENPLLSRAIANAQQVLAKNCRTDRPARSAEEWMTLNAPPSPAPERALPPGVKKI